MSDNIYTYLEENFNIKTDYQFKRDYIKEPLKIKTYLNDCELPYKEDLEFLYNKCCLRLPEIQQIFNITITKARQFVHNYGLKKTPQEAFNCSNLMKEDKIERLMRTKLITDILGKDYLLSEIQKKRLKPIVENYGKKELQDNEYARSVGYMILYDLTNYYGRIRRLMELKSKGISAISLYAHVLRYGKENGIRIHKERKQHHIDSLPSSLVFWTSKGYSEKEAKKRIKDMNHQKGLLAREKLKGFSDYTIRSWKYWVRQGYTEEEAKEKAYQVNVFTLEKCIKKYGEEGLNFWNERQKKWLQTLNDKSDEEKKLINLKRGHSIESIMARGFTYDDAMKKSNDYYAKRKNYSDISQNCFKYLEARGNFNLLYKTKKYEKQFGKYLVDCYDVDRKIVIEFNGDYWHARKGYYDNVLIYGKSTDQVRENDQKRLNKILSYDDVKKIIIIWESDYRKNPSKIIEKTINEMFNEYDDNKIVEIFIDN